MRRNQKVTSTLKKLNGSRCRERENEEGRKGRVGRETGTVHIERSRVFTGGEGRSL